MQSIKPVLMSLLLLALFTDLAICIGNLRDASDGSQFYVDIDYKYTWFQANHECARRNMQLVEIQNGQKNKIVLDVLRTFVGTTKDLWIGGNDGWNTNGGNQPFYWSSTGNRVIYSNFLNGEPNNLKNEQHCIHTWSISPTYEWADGQCYLRYGFICEKKTC